MVCNENVKKKASKPTFSFAVYESSILFDVNSSFLQHSSDFNCSDIVYNQIISNVVSISSDKNVSASKSASNFVKTFFRTLPVVILV